MGLNVFETLELHMLEQRGLITDDGYDLLRVLVGALIAFAAGLLVGFKTNQALPATATMVSGAALTAAWCVFAGKSFAKKRIHQLRALS